MKYLKTYSQIQRENAVKRLKRDILFVFGILAFLLLLGLVGALAG